MNSPQPSQKTVPPQTPSFLGRPWWQWTIFVLLLAGAAINHFWLSNREEEVFSRVEIPPRTVEVAADLTRVEHLPADPGALAGCNLIVVTIDTTRADRIGCLGNDRIHTPTLDGLAAQGVLFPNATAVAPTTIPTHCSIMTGLYPLHHGARTNGLFRLAASNTTLAESLKAAGYETGAIVSAFVLDSRFGVDQGFDSYQDDFSNEQTPDAFRFPERIAEPTTNLALDWIDAHAESQPPFFLWLHYFDPHAVYKPPAEYRKLCHGNTYDGEISYVDAQLARLVALLDEKNIADKTLIAIVGDHGESLGQHNESSHGYFVYEATQRVPLIMRCGTRLGGGCVFEPRVSQVDIVPTVCSLLDVTPPADLDGVDLTQSLPARPIFAETYHGTMEHGWAALFAVYDGNYKYIHGPTPELFDIVADPLETKNLLRANANLVPARLEELTAFFGDELTSAAAPDPTEVLGAQDFSNLEALGYVFAGPGEVEENEERPDPHVMIELLNRVEQIVFGELPTNGPERAITLLEEFVAQHPDFLPAWRYLGLIYRDNNRIDDSIHAFENARRLRPDSSGITYALAYTHVMKGQHEQAIALLEENAERYPQHFDTIYLLGTEYLNTQQFSKAADKLRQAFLAQPDFGIVGDQMVGAFVLAGRSAELPETLAAGEAHAPQSVRVAKARSFYLITKGECDAAEATLREAVKLHPKDPDAIGGLACFLASRPDVEQRQPYEAIAMLERACQETGYSDPILLYSLSFVYAVVGRLDEAITLSDKGLALTGQDAERFVLTQLMQLNKTERRAKELGQNALVPAPPPQSP